MKEKKILKIKLVDGLLQITYDEIHTTEESGVTINKVSIEGGHKVHQDMIEAMSRLNMHAAIICDQVKVAGKGKGQSHVGENGSIITIPVKLEPGDITTLGRITVYGISIGGDEEKPGVVLSMKRKLENGKVIVINTPFTEFGQENGYKYRNKLSEDVEICCQEALAYLEGKHAPDPQLAMFEEEQKQ